MSSEVGPLVDAAFGPTADPAAYVPRVALEAALAALVESVGRAPACAALVGEAGLGKTLLLRVLAERLGGAFECLYVPFPRLAPAELWSWAAAKLGIGGGADDRAAVLERAHRREAEGRGLVLLVDDAGALPGETRAELIEACRSRGFSLVMAFDSGDGAQLRDLPPHVRRVELGPPMTLAETRTDLHARLRRVEPDGALDARLGPARIAELHEASAGVPARLHALLDSWSRGGALELRGVAAPSEPAARAAPPPATPPPPAATPPAPPAAAPPALAAAAAPAPPLERAPLPVRPTPRRGRRLRRKRKRGFPLELAALVVALLLVGIWRFAPQLVSERGLVGAPLASLDAPRSDPGPSAPEALPVPAPTAEPPAPEPLAAAPDASQNEAQPAAPAEEPAAEPLVAESEPPLAAPAEVPQRLAAESEARPAEAAPAAPAEVEPGAPAAPAEVEPAAPAVASAPAEAPSPPAAPAPAPREEPAPLAAPPAPAAPGLAPPPPGPRLSVNAEPWAEIRLDGRPVGETPLGELRVSPGSHLVSARLPDGRVLERRIEASAGDVYVVFE